MTQILNSLFYEAAFLRVKFHISLMQSSKNLSQMGQMFANFVERLTLRKVARLLSRFNATHRHCVTAITRIWTLTEHTMFLGLG